MKFPQHPDRKRNRLFGVDYSHEAIYFLTSCVQEMVCVFGEVLDGEMQLNAYGQIAVQQWHGLLEKYSYVQAHAFVIMPNHMHALIEIQRKEEEYIEPVYGQASENDSVGSRIKSVSQIIGEYKTMTSKFIRQAGLKDFAWQRSFHDHIIRDEKGFHNIKEYIENNPANWAADRFFR